LANELPVCPHCKVVDEPYVKRRVTGYANESYTITGEFSELNIEHLDYGRSMIVRCGKCGRIRHDIKLVWDSNQIEAITKVIKGVNDNG